jgi:hypothetical protein
LSRGHGVNHESPERWIERRESSDRSSFANSLDTRPPNTL